MLAVITVMIGILYKFYLQWYKVRKFKDIVRCYWPSSPGCLFLSIVLSSSNFTSSLLNNPPCITWNLWRIKLSTDWTRIPIWIASFILWQRYSNTVSTYQTWVRILRENLKPIPRRIDRAIARSLRRGRSRSRQWKPALYQLQAPAILQKHLSNECFTATRELGVELVMLYKVLLNF